MKSAVFILAAICQAQLPEKDSSADSVSTTQGFENHQDHRNVTEYEQESRRPDDRFHQDHRNVTEYEQESRRPDDRFHHDVPKDLSSMSPEDRAELCRENYVDADQCDKWIADESDRQDHRNATEYERESRRPSDRFQHQIPKNLTSLSAEDQAVLCRENYVDADQCDKWIADQVARSASTLFLAASSFGFENNGQREHGNAMPEISGNMTSEEKATWCHNNYVDPDQCDKWVADQIDRRDHREESERERELQRPSNRFNHEIPKNLTSLSAEDQAQLCRENYVDAAQCDKWIANEARYSASMLFSETLPRTSSVVLAAGGLGAVAAMVAVTRRQRPAGASEPLLAPEIVL